MKDCSSAAPGKRTGRGVGVEMGDYAGYANLAGEGYGLGRQCDGRGDKVELSVRLMVWYRSLTLSGVSS